MTFGELLAERGELAPPKEGKAKTGTPITRAARRAGITERDANPEKPKELRTKADFEAAADRIVDVVLGGDLPALPFFREVMLERLAERFGKEAEGTRSPEELERRHDRREERLASVSRLLSGGLWVSDDDSDPAELALLHVAAAQIKAVMLAMTTSDGIGADGWALDHDEMTDADIQAALSGVVAT
ncbi:MAG TPA: hypothetical protein VFR23_26210, partial [Jiangellaceae bacterium]|nr:hypothetical protein [Jiangellaceae bacterium]